MKPLKLKLRYNAPVTLTFAFLCTAVVILDLVTGHFLTQNLFSVPGRGGFDFRNIFSYLRLFLHAAGHSGFEHLLSNFAFILLLGPVLEEKYGSAGVLFMILVTAFVTGLLNVLFFANGLLGASGIVFMMILLASFTNIRSGEIPLTFILVVLIYVTQEIIRAFQPDSVSQFAHLIGGVCGGVFGFFLKPKNGAAAGGLTDAGDPLAP